MRRVASVTSSAIAATDNQRATPGRALPFARASTRRSTHAAPTMAGVDALGAQRVARERPGPRSGRCVPRSVTRRYRRSSDGAARLTVAGNAPQRATRPGNPRSPPVPPTPQRRRHPARSRPSRRLRDRDPHASHTHHRPLIAALSRSETPSEIPARTCIRKCRRASPTSRPTHLELDLHNALERLPRARAPSRAAFDDSTAKRSFKRLTDLLMPLSSISRGLDACVATIADSARVRTTTNVHGRAVNEHDRAVVAVRLSSLRRQLFVAHCATDSAAHCAQATRDCHPPRTIRHPPARWVTPARKCRGRSGRRRDCRRGLHATSARKVCTQGLHTARGIPPMPHLWAQRRQ